MTANKKKVAIIFGQQFHGAARAFNEAECLKNAGHTPILICYNDVNREEIDLSRGYQIIKLALNSRWKNILFGLDNSIPLFSYGWSNKIKWLVKEFDIDILFIHDLFMMRAALLANRNLKLPIVLNLHENYPAVVRSYSWTNKFPKKYIAKAWKWEKLEESYLKNADKILVLSETYKKLLLQKHSILKEDQFIVFPNVPDVKQLERFAVDEQILRKSPEDFIIFYFGLIGKRRGLSTCIDAIKKLKANYPNIKLLIIGPVERADKESFLDQINQEDIKNNVVYIEWIDMSDLASYTKASDVCISPIIKNDQHESGVANKVFQYMYYGKPLIVSNCTPQQRIVEEENCGIVFESENSEDLCGQIIKLYEDAPLRELMGTNGKKSIIDKYNLEKYSEKIIELIQTI